MKSIASVLGLALVAGLGMAADKEKEKGAPAEESVVAYESKTKGAVQVRSVAPGPVHWFDVFKDDKRAISGNPPLLDSTIELEPGTYELDVNRTRRKVTIEAGKKTVVWTGELVVEGKGASWYVPWQGKDRKLVSAPPTLGRAIPLFAGTYRVTVHVGTEDKEIGEAKVVAGKKTTLKY
jgi:hypothetical protein